MGDSPDQHEQLERLLEAIRSGDDEADGELPDFIYQQLRKQAHKKLRFERRGHTLRTTELVNEAFLSLAGTAAEDWHNRALFFGAAANAMRRVLIQHYRNRNRLKRAVEFETDVEIDDIVPQGKDKMLLRLDDALYALKKLNQAQVRVVEMRFFAGLPLEEIAQVMNVSLSTVKNHWTHAKTWLKREMES